MTTFHDAAYTMAAVSATVALYRALIKKGFLTRDEAVRIFLTKRWRGRSRRKHRRKSRDRAGRQQQPTSTASLQKSEIHRRKALSPNLAMSQPAVASPQLQAAGAIRQFAATLRDTQFMPPERMREYQRSLLERLIRHARVHVPFYRDSGRLDPLFRRDDTIDWERWREIPLLTRKQVQDAGTALHAEQVPPETGRTWTLTTSGSTGEPVSVLHCALSGETAWTAILLRDFERHNIDTTQRFARIGRFPQQEAFPVLRRSNAWSGELREDRYRCAAARYPGDDDARGNHQCRDRVQTRVSWIEPGHDRAVVQLGSRSPSFRSGHRRNLSTGDRLTEETKQLAIDHLQCRIVNRYSSEECGWIASVFAQIAIGFMYIPK